MLQVENISFIYPDKHKALNNLSFNINKGSKTFFHGANGAGKTTLFQCLNGLLKCKTGTIRIAGKEIKKTAERMRLIGIVFQNATDQIVSSSVYDEVAFGPLNMGLPVREVRQRVEQALISMDIDELKEKPPHFLSYGQMKRVTIAAVLAMGQDIIILDEPTAGLDAIQAEELIRILNELADNGKTLLISTHDADFSYRCAEQVIVLEKGHKIADGGAVEVFSDQNVLDRGHIIKPIVLDLFHQMLEQKNIDINDVPRTKSELIEKLKSKVQGYKGSF